MQFSRAVIHGWALNGRRGLQDAVGGTEPMDDETFIHGMNQVDLRSFYYFDHVRSATRH